MSEQTNKKIRLIYGYIFTALTIVVGVLLIWQVVDLYLNGATAEVAEDVLERKGMYSRTVMGERLSDVAVPCILWLIMAIASYVLSEVFPVKETAKPMDSIYVLSRMKKRMPAQVDGNLKSLFEKEKKCDCVILIVKLVCAVISLAFAIYGIVYLCTPSYFPKLHVTREVITMAQHLFPLAFLALLLWMGASIYEQILAKRRLSGMKQLIAGQKVQKKQPNKVVAFFESKQFLLGARITACVLGIVLVIVGVKNGGMTAMLAKAINICLECVGIG